MHCATNDFKFCLYVTIMDLKYKQKYITLPAINEFKFYLYVIIIGLIKLTNFLNLNPNEFNIGPHSKNNNNSM